MDYTKRGMIIDAFRRHAEDMEYRAKHIRDCIANIEKAEESEGRKLTGAEVARFLTTSGAHYQPQALDWGYIMAHATTGPD